MKMTKKLIISSLVVSSVFLVGCGAPKLTPDEIKVRQISDTRNCEFIDTVYFETRPQTITHYARKNTVAKGGNAYQSVQGDHEKVMGTDVIKNTIDIYKCDFK
jgi:hypothetical protein